MRRENTVVDAVRVPATGDPRIALVDVDHDALARDLECEVTLG